MTRLNSSPRPVTARPAFAAVFTDPAVFRPEASDRVCLRLTDRSVARPAGTNPVSFVDAVVTRLVGPVAVLDCADGFVRWAHIEDLVPPFQAPSLS